MTRLFVSQERLDAWVLEGQAELEGARLTVEERYVLEICPAVRFLRVAGGGADPHQLLGRVKTEAQLRQMLAEHYMDSVLVGEIGYEVQQGFVGESMA
ncbi:MAG: hypothetical protein IT371_24075 [Deltaproteobacteria bacterium]|nr:hypothetical protein [Deltaproteobacteria bacterium]